MPIQAADFDLTTATIADINQAFDAGALSSEKLTQLYLNRIAAYDKQGPKINSIVTLNAQARATARELHAEHQAKGPRSKLHGVPVVLKDLYDTKDMPTSGGFHWVASAAGAGGLHQERKRSDRYRVLRSAL